jgi:hypothetical protein
MYKVSCSWPDAISYNNRFKFCANLGKNATQTITMIRRVFREVKHILSHQGDCSHATAPGVYSASTRKRKTVSGE